MYRDNYIVEGLNSEGMKEKVKNALEKIEGVSSVAIDSGRRSLEVSYNSFSIAEEIRDCLENTAHLIQ